MNKIILNRVAVDRLYELFNKINQSKDFGHVTLESEGDNGIGDVIIRGNIQINRSGNR